jgi:hypothetical protein
MAAEAQRQGKTGGGLPVARAVLLAAAFPGL